MRFLPSVGGLLLGDDELKLLATLRRERQQEPRIWVARLACALGAALTGFGTNWLIGLLLAALALTGKRARRLAYGCFFGAVLAAALLIDAVAADSNIYGALLLFGLSAVLFALGFVLVLTTGVTLFGHSLALRRLRREHDVDGLIAQLASSDPVTRARAADMLAPLADPRAEQSLLRALADPDLDVRASAARALGVLKSEAAVELLLQALGDEETDVRHAAAWALGQIGDERAIEPLLRLVTDQDDLVQDAARDALQSLGKAAVPG
jgi:HEAT repeats